MFTGYPRPSQPHLPWQGLKCQMLAFVNLICTEERGGEVKWSEISPGDLKKLSFFWQQGNKLTHPIPYPFASNMNIMTAAVAILWTPEKSQKNYTELALISLSHWTNCLFQTFYANNNKLLLLLGFLLLKIECIPNTSAILLYPKIQPLQKMQPHHVPQCKEVSLMAGLQESLGIKCKPKLGVIGWTA